MNNYTNTITNIKHLKHMYTFTQLTHTEICERIETARKRHKLTKAEFSRMAGYTSCALNKWLINTRFSSVSYNRVIEVIKKLDNSPEQIEIKFTPKPVEKQTYGVLSIETAIKMLKDAGYKISKRVEKWEEI